MENLRCVEFYWLLCFFALFSCDSDYKRTMPEPDTHYPAINSPHPQEVFSGYRLRWHDEFNASALDNSKWSYDTEGNAAGWGNNELQFYTGSPQNAFIKNDALVLRAQVENKGGKNYTSARLHTHGKYAVQYGVIEARILLPADAKGRTDSGTWPAFWLLGQNFNGWGHNRYAGATTPWPCSGEIDIMESNHSTTGYNKISSAIHYDSRNSQCSSYASAIHTYQTKDTNINNPTSDYHIYTAEWTKDFVEFYLDYKTYHKIDFSPKHNEFQNKFFLLLNLAVGGNFPGTPNPSNYPQEMAIDWVRVYSK